jgi:formiminotetrahydrofolate cyclodeaminase
MIKDHTVGSYLDALASGAATPGGGAAAALTVAQAAALISMACNFTLGRAAFGTQALEVERLNVVSEGVRSLALMATQEDVVAFERLKAAYGLPQNDPTRQEALQQALKTAALVPAQLFRPMEELVEAAVRLRAICNPNLVSDIDVALSLLRGAAGGLRFIANANLDRVEEPNFGSDVKADMHRFEMAIQDTSNEHW